MRRYLLYTIIAVVSMFQTIAAQTITLSDNAKVSLLTCSPGYETYSKYGHSAIRVCDTEQGIDYTFNYGVFNFNTNNFYIKFVKGQTWYQLDVEDTDWFIKSSKQIGRTTYEQELNLTQEQRQLLLDKLLDNYKPKNRYYLYNFVFDNCATRPYKLIKQVVPEIENTVLNTPIDFEDKDAQPTFRQLINHYSEQYSWPKFGINFIFGADADKIPSPEQRLFLPEQLMLLMQTGRLADGEPLIKSDNTQPFVIKSQPWIISPYMLLILISLLIIAITIVDIIRNKSSLWLDNTLWIGGALLAFIATYLSFFSIHPLVKHNLNLVPINPLLIVLPLLACWKKTRKWLKEHLFYIGICMIVLCMVRIICLPLQTWHWIIIIPILHSIRLLLIGKTTGIQHKTKNKKHHTRIITLIALLNFALQLKAEQPLTVVVCVDGLSTQALNQMRNYWLQGGLRTLDEEAHEATLSFSHLLYGGCESVATIMSGVTPDEHGISANYYFDRKERKIKNIFTDTEEKGIGTNLQLSPKSLLAPTIADEFRMTHSDRSKVYAVGINPETTIILAGHAANACTWLETDNLCWATTGYYREGLPAAADKMNMSGRISNLAEQQWTPRMDPNMYMHPTAEEKKKGFTYLQKNILTQSPAANTLVIELALELQKSASLGTDKQPDLLLLQLTVNSPAAQSDFILTAEQEDMYIRLNQDLGYLMEQLNKQIGSNNYRLILFGKPIYGYGSSTIQQANINAGLFNTERTAALCNTYLMALYGHERWIDGGFLNNIYLNRTLIEQKKINLYDIQRQVSNFLLEAEGTKAAFPYCDALLLPNDEQSTKLRHTLNKHTSGDVVFLLQPMWRTTQNNDVSYHFISQQNLTAPLFIWTNKITTMPDETLTDTQVKNIILNY